MQWNEINFHVNILRQTLTPMFWWLYFMNKPKGTSGYNTNTRNTRQALYVQRNNEVRSPKHCCSGEAIIITYSECVSVALGIRLLAVEKQ
jgi:hypothetical protein